MKRLATRLGITAGIGATAIAVTAMTFPVFAGVSTDSSWFTKMQSFMSQAFTSQQRQQFMGSSAMQELHNSPAMQQSMQQRDFGQMQALMNSDQALKDQIGAQNVARMNQMMGQLRGETPSGK